MTDHVARVRVPEGVWVEFRRGLGARPISRALGDLVEREVARVREARIRQGSATDRELIVALEDARDAQEQLAQIVARLEARAGSTRPTEHKAW